MNLYTYGTPNDIVWYYYELVGMLNLHSLVVKLNTLHTPKQAHGIVL